jgi:P4 family phage/plasmid primase-like protien
MNKGKLSGQSGQKRINELEKARIQDYIRKNGVLILGEGGSVKRSCLRKACRDQLLKDQQFMAVGGEQGEHDKTLYRYDDKNGIWVLDAPSYIGYFVNTWFAMNADDATQTDRNEILNWIKSNFWIPRDKWEQKSISLLAVQNGVLLLPEHDEKDAIDDPDSISCFIMQKFNPHYYLTNRLNVKWVQPTQRETPDCPKIKAFLHEILNSQQEIDAIFEFIGRCLSQSIFTQNIMVFLGSGSNGKSTLCRIIREFLGKENVSNETLTRLISNRFACYQLYRKWLNIDPDVTSKQTFKQTGVLKALVGGDDLVAERKFCDAFYFMYQGGAIVCANGLPSSADDTDAFYRRWIFFDFPNQFTSEKGNEKNQDQLIAELTTPDEFSGLLYEAIKGLQRLIKNGKYSNDTMTFDEKRKKWNMNCDSVVAYTFLTLEYDSDYCIDKDALYDNYVNWCRANHYTILQFPVFARRLKTEMSRITDGRHTLSNNVRIHTFDGIRSKIDKSLGYKLKKTGSLTQIIEKTPVTPDTPDSSSQLSDQSDQKSTNNPDLTDYAPSKDKLIDTYKKAGFSEDEANKDLDQYPNP